MRSTVMELQLLSASAALGEPADCAAVYHLEEAPGLPVISQAHPWAGRTICALRDRSVPIYVFLNSPRLPSLPVISFLLAPLCFSLCSLYLLACTSFSVFFIFVLSPLSSPPSLFPLPSSFPFSPLSTTSLVVL